MIEQITLDRESKVLSCLRAPGDLGVRTMLKLRSPRKFNKLAGSQGTRAMRLFFRMREASLITFDAEDISSAMKNNPIVRRRVDNILFLVDPNLPEKPIRNAGAIMAFIRERAGYTKPQWKARQDIIEYSKRTGFNYRLFF